MQDVYEPQRAAALVNEARGILALLKSEAGQIGAQVARIRHGQDDTDSSHDTPVAASRPAFWRFWR
jgi:hypothetical protein